jgi:hypothetical protein
MWIHPYVFELLKFHCFPAVHSQGQMCAHNLGPGVPSWGGLAVGRTLLRTQQEERLPVSPAALLLTAESIKGRDSWGEQSIGDGDRGHRAHPQDLLSLLSRSWTEGRGEGPGRALWGSHCQETT